MANFSKEYVDLLYQHLPQAERVKMYDFSIIEIADSLVLPKRQPNSIIYQNVICEGFGFVAVGKNVNNDIFLAMPVNGGSELYWEPYNKTANESTL
jgi:hypothetical protein